jgi:hemolysin type calcium-binding protein
MFRRTQVRSFSRKNHRHTLAIEALENRQMLSVNSGADLRPVASAEPLDTSIAEAISFDRNTGRLSLRGDDDNNNSLVSIDNRGTIDTIDDEVVASITRGNDTITMRVNQFADGNPFGPQVHEIVFEGFGGNDTFANLTNINSLARGGAGDDHMTGGSGVDMFFGGDGNDYMVLDAGNDMAWGGSGNDTMLGGDGDDVLWGEAGDDIIKCGAGDDVAYGGSGNDQIWGGEGANSLFGGPGSDQIHYGDSENSIDNSANEQISGTYANPTVLGHNGDELLKAGNGHGLVSNVTTADLHGINAGNGFGNADCVDHAWQGSSDDPNSSMAGGHLPLGFDGDNHVLIGNFIKAVDAGNSGARPIAVRGEYSGRDSVEYYELDDLIFGKEADDMEYVGARDIAGGLEVNSLYVARKKTGSMPERGK